MRSRLGEGRRRWFPRSGDTGADGNVLVLTAELVARARGGRAGAIRNSVSVIIVANFPVIIVVVIVTAIAIVREARGGRARRRATTTTSTATDTTTANAVDLHHFAVDRSRRLGSTRRGRDAATDHHHQMISPPPPPRSQQRLLPLPFFLHFRGCTTSVFESLPFRIQTFFFADRKSQNADECLQVNVSFGITLVRSITPENILLCVEQFS